MMVPNRKSNSDMTKRSRKVLPLSEKVKLLDLMKEKKSYAEVAKIYDKNESSIREIVRKEKEIRARFALAPESYKLKSTARNKCFVKEEEALTLSEEGVSRKNDGNMSGQKSLSLHDDSSTGSSDMSNTKRKSSDAGNLDTPKRIRKALPYSEKINVLDLIRKEKKSYAEVAKIYGKNESSIRGIVKKEKEIRATFAVSPQTAKFRATVRNKCLAKVEKALILWVEDRNRKHAPINGNILRQKALSLYKDFSKENPGTCETKPFTASKGWLHRFKNRFELKNINITGEAMSAASTFPTELKKLIKEKGYHPKQVFNCDETELFWKMSDHIHKNSNQAAEHKAWKDRLTLVLCGNAAGHMIKPGVLYGGKNPHSLKNKNDLPVFWQHKQNTWVTATLFIEWFQQCFIPEVKKYLEEEQLDFKVLLIIDKGPGHPESVCCENENVKVVFFPTNTTSMLQPVDQGIIWCVKDTYTRLVFEHIRSEIDTDPSLDIMQCWKSFSIADAIMCIKAAMDELKPGTVNACWKNLWSEVVNDSNGFPEMDGEVRKIIHAARQSVGQGFVNMFDEEAEDRIEGHREVLTNEQLEELVKAATDEDEETEVEPRTWTLQKFTEVFSLIKEAKEKITKYDPQTERSLKVNRMITDALEPLQEHFEELKKKKQPFPTSMFSPKVSTPKTPTAEDTEPSLTSAFNNPPLDVLSERQ